MIVWRFGGKIVRTVVCCIVYDSCAQSYARSREQFLNLHLGLVLDFVLCVRLGLTLLYVSSVSLYHYVPMSLAFVVGRRFFSTKPRDWLRRTSPK